MSEKRFNRNAFHEKFLHRYLLEGLYLRRPSVIKMLPLVLQKKAISVVIPEATESSTRPDFKIYFKGNAKPFWLEVKWTMRSSVNQNQHKMLSKNRGMIACLDTGHRISSDNVHVAFFDVQDIESWLSFSSGRLWRDAVGKYGVIGPRKSWLLVLRGSYKNNWTKMVKQTGEKSKHRFWAFKNNSASFEAIFNLSLGDYIYVMDLKLDRNFQSLPKNFRKAGGKTIQLSKFIVTDPHFIDERNRGAIFETLGEPPIYDRKWIHFVKFKEYTLGRKQQVSPADDRVLEKLWSKVTQSANIGGGSPVDLTQIETIELEGFIK